MHHAVRTPAHPVRTALTALAVTAVALVAFPLTASAHVRVHPDSTTSGSYAELTFRVPNESATAGTVRLQVTLPQDHPLTSVSTTPVAGWTVKVAEAPLPTPVVVRGATLTKAPRTVTWTADRGVQIGPGEYLEFPISVGPLPEPGELVLPAIQTYSDGTEVAWDDPPAADGSEPDHPAPAFAVTASGGAAHGGAADPAATNPAAAAPIAPVPDRSDRTARWLGGAALALSLLAAAGAMVSWRSTRSRGSSVATGATP
jgi:uncharacterized protein YcnI